MLIRGDAMNELFSAALACMGILCAGGAGVNLWTVFDFQRRCDRYRAHIRDGQNDALSAGTNVGAGSQAPAFDVWIIKRIVSTSRMLSLGHGVRLIPDRFIYATWISEHAKAAGISNEVTPEGFCETRLRMAIFGGVIGVIVGCMISFELAALLFVVGVVIGWRLASRAVRHLTQWRAQEMESHLPEMLDVVALGMRSGLSFDRSLSLYIDHFDTLLAKAFDLAQKQWTCGLIPRDEALCQLAASYDSTTFGRVIESIVRSLRFGSSMVESLEAASTEARASYRAAKQEQVAKAPVKMMIPTGVFILPAMLILVLGPVLLELVGGF